MLSGGSGLFCDLFPVEFAGFCCVGIIDCLVLVVGEFGFVSWSLCLFLSCSLIVLLIPFVWMSSCDCFSVLLCCIAWLIIWLVSVSGSFLKLVSLISIIIVHNVYDGKVVYEVLKSVVHLWPEILKAALN